MGLGEGAADFYVYATGCMVTSNLGLPGIKRFCGTQKHQLEHVKFQATEKSGHPSWLTVQPPPMSWVRSNWPHPYFLSWGFIQAKT